MDVMLPEYYRLRKWDENGIPTAAAVMPHAMATR
jgi:aldehyde:ferredoxin oxidoreductase